MMKLYGSGPSRWVRPYWTLKELGVPFEPIPTSIAKGETRTPEFLAINPFGKIPVFVDQDVTLFESAAICTYLADKYPEKQLIPKPGTPERGLHDQWVSFSVSELEQPLWRIIRHRFLYPETSRIPAEVALAKNDFRKIAAVLQNELDREFIVGDRFSVADIMIAYTLKWASLERAAGENLLAEFPGLIAYLDKLMTRPAFPRELYG